jgi:pentatricopeptide repeat protein
MCAKLLLSSIDSLCNKGNHEEAIRLMNGMLETSVRKVGSLYRAFDRAKKATQLDKGKGKALDGQAEDESEALNGPNELEWREVERAMPVAAPNFALESYEAFVRGELAATHANPSSHH